MANSNSDEQPEELDFSKLQVVKAGKGRKWLQPGRPNSDYDWRLGAGRHLQYVLDRSLEAGETADTETGVDGKLTPVAETPGAVMLDADVAAVFKNAAAVNTALRLVIKMAEVAPLTSQDAK